VEEVEEEIENALKFVVASMYFDIKRPIDEDLE